MYMYTHMYIHIYIYIYMSIGNYPEVLSQWILAGILLIRRLGVQWRGADNMYIYIYISIYIYIYIYI